MQPTAYLPPVFQEIGLLFGVCYSSCTLVLSKPSTPRLSPFDIGEMLALLALVSIQGQKKSTGSTCLRGQASREGLGSRATAPFTFEIAI